MSGCDEGAEKLKKEWQSYYQLAFPQIPQYDDVSPDSGREGIPEEQPSRPAKRLRNTGGLHRPKLYPKHRVSVGLWCVLCDLARKNGKLD